jgi:hypothetical protein
MNFFLFILKLTKLGFSTLLFHEITVILRGNDFAYLIIE